MTKNIIILNELNEQIGRTYPKRAKGLLKNGRAEYVDDCTIRLLNTQASAILENDMEDILMAEVINFNTREFKFDKTCEGKNVGSRMFITDAWGNNTEVFEIGDGSDAWTQIACDKVLEPDTDYVFRFAVSRKSELADYAVSQFIVDPIEGSEDDWDNRYVYNLNKDEFKPLLNKIIAGKNYLVYEIPFKTDSIVNYRFVFVNQFAVTRVMAAASNEDYAKFSDADKSFFEETKDQIKNILPKDFNVNFPKDFNLEQTLQTAVESVKNVADKVTRNFQAASEPFEDIEGVQIRHVGANIIASKLALDFYNAGDNFIAKYTGCNIEDEGNIIDFGEPSQNSKINFTGCNIGGQIFAGVASKMGDNCQIHYSACNVGKYDGSVVSHGSFANGCSIIITNSNIYESNLIDLLRRVGNDCTIEIKNGNIVPTEGIYDEYVGEVVSNVTITFENTVVSQGMVDKINSKLGEGCTFNRQ